MLNGLDLQDAQWLRSDLLDLLVGVGLLFEACHCACERSAEELPIPSLFKDKAVEFFRQFGADPIRDLQLGQVSPIRFCRDSLARRFYVVSAQTRSAQR